MNFTITVIDARAKAMEEDLWILDTMISYCFVVRIGTTWKMEVVVTKRYALLPGATAQSKCESP